MNNKKYKLAWRTSDGKKGESEFEHYRAYRLRKLVNALNQKASKTKFYVKKVAQIEIKTDLRLAG